MNIKIKKISEKFNYALHNCSQWHAITWLKNEFYKTGKVKLWVVGGTIRDFILETSNMIIDVDIILENCKSFNEIEEVIKRGGTFSKNMMGGYKWYPKSEISKNSEKIEIDLWRIEEAIEQDDEVTPEMAVSRFDLNINSLGWSLNEEYLINPLGGLEILLDDSKSMPMDLLTEKIKPENEPRLILRAIKYSSKLGIPLGEKTVNWIKSNENQLDKYNDDRINYIFRSIDIFSIKDEIKKCCEIVFSDKYYKKVTKALYNK